jgi:tRNA-2-methylthio-N6-dimethylallyladenosine synthase
MNVSDSERISSLLEKEGYKSTSEQEADLIVVNSCSVRQRAVDRIWGGIKKWKKNNQKILITGCVLPSDRKKFKEHGVDFIETQDLPKEFEKNKLLDYFEIEPKRVAKTAFITIMTGCNNFCSYCAVPYTKGREVSRPRSAIIAEVKKVVNDGFKDILLLGQNVNSFGKTTKDNSEFIKLLKEIDSVPGDFKFNFMSSNPQDMSDNLISCFAGLKKWPRELHFAMQSGDDEILKAMNRKYTSGQFLALISKIKYQIPARRQGGSNIKISTDIIVGFPGETKKQFENTYKLCKKIGFVKAYIGQYSPRAGTISSKMIDDVTQAEKKRRWLKLDKLINS